MAQMKMIVTCCPPEPDSGHPDLRGLEAEWFPPSPRHWLWHQPGLRPVPPPHGREAQHPPFQLPRLDHRRAWRLQWYAARTKNKISAGPSTGVGLLHIFKYSDINCVFDVDMVGLVSKRNGGQDGLIFLYCVSVSLSARVERCECCRSFSAGPQPTDGGRGRQ